MRKSHELYFPPSVRISLQLTCCPRFPATYTHLFPVLTPFLGFLIVDVLVGPQAAKATIMKRVDGYMKRAETLKEIVEEQAAAKNGMGTGGAGG